jgi:nitric oxide dioxygenase
MPNLSVVNFYEDLDAAHAALPGYQAGRMTVGQLPVWDHAQAPVYMCGPLPFMHQQWRDLLALGVPVEKIHREVFGPDMLDHLI